MPPVSLAALCICTVIQELAHPHSADSTFPLIHGVHPRQVIGSQSSCFHWDFLLTFLVKMINLDLKKTDLFILASFFYFFFPAFSNTLYTHMCKSDLPLTISSCTVSSSPGESPAPPPSTVSSSALSTSAVPPPPQPKQGSSSQQDRKVPPPIGTERLARIRQTGSVNPPLLTTSYTASVGQGGIWSFGVGSASGKNKCTF